MEISLANERALLIKEQFTLDQAEGRAWGRKVEAFGRMARVTGILQKPKDHDFELVYKEHRLQSFWHVVCSGRYVYERQNRYAIQIDGEEVEKVILTGQEYSVNDGRVDLVGTEFCREEPHQDLFIDAYTLEPNPDYSSYLDFAANEIPVSYLDELTGKGIVVVPPQAKATAIVRNALLGILKTVRADRILEDEVEIERVDLYYRPIYAFQYRWKSRKKEGVLEFDGVTGEMRLEGKTFQQYMGKLLDPDFLFDVGIDTIDLLVPGGGIAIKLAKKGIDVAKKRNS